MGYRNADGSFTPDVEPDELLTVSRKEVIDIYRQVRSALFHGGKSSGEEMANVGREMILTQLFGDKCLPDVPSSDANTDPQPEEPSSDDSKTEPRFKVGQRMYIKRINQIGTVCGYSEEEDGIYYQLEVESKGTVSAREEYLEPYTEPQPEEHRNLSNFIVNSDKSTDNDNATKELYDALFALESASKAARQALVKFNTKEQ